MCVFRVCVFGGVVEIARATNQMQSFMEEIEIDLWRCGGCWDEKEAPATGQQVGQVGQADPLFVAHHLLHCCTVFIAQCSILYYYSVISLLIALM